MRKFPIIGLALALQACSNDPTWSLHDVDAATPTSTVLPFGRIKHLPDDDPRASGPHCAGCRVFVRLWNADDEGMSGWSFEAEDPTMVTVSAGTDVVTSADLTLQFLKPGATTVRAIDDRGELRAELPVSSEEVASYRVVPWPDLRLTAADHEVLDDRLTVVAGSSHWGREAPAFGVQWLDGGGSLITGIGLLRVEPEPTPVAATSTDTGLVQEQPTSPTLTISDGSWRQAEVIAVRGVDAPGGPYPYRVLAADRPMGTLDVHVVDSADATTFEVISRELQRPSMERPITVLLSRVRTADGHRVLGAPVRWSWEEEVVDAAGVAFSGSGDSVSVAATLTGTSQSATASAAGQLVDTIQDWQDEQDVPFSCGSYSSCSQGGSGALGAWSVLLAAVVGMRRRSPR